MSVSLREQRRIRTSASIASAALELFAERGYSAVTVAEVAAAAGVGERTLYRYFADKDDLLFGEDEQLRATLRSAIEQQPEGPSPLAILRTASAAVARALQGRREEVARRARVIASSPALSARDRAKRGAWEALVAEALSQRGVTSAQAQLLGRIGVACHDDALSRWLERDRPGPSLEVELDETFRQLAALVAEDGPHLARPPRRRRDAGLAVGVAGTGDAGPTPKLLPDASAGPTRQL